MLRFVGILTGSALAIGLLIVALGVPEFGADTAPAKTIHEPVAAPPPVIPVVAEAESVEPPVPEPAEEPLAETVPEAPTEPTAEELIEQIFNPGPDEIVEENWYAFWSPFRSELAANGFVARLQETTGIDYRVVKIKTGVYEVAFAYTDDADIQDKLARISNATGLDMSGG